jgi:hypothetical protein
VVAEWEYWEEADRKSRNRERIERSYAAPQRVCTLLEPIYADPNRNQQLLETASRGLRLVPFWQPVNDAAQTHVGRAAGSGVHTSLSGDLSTVAVAEAAARHSTESQPHDTRYKDQ